MSESTHYHVAERDPASRDCNYDTPLRTLAKARRDVWLILATARYDEKLDVRTIVRGHLWKVDDRIISLTECTDEDCKPRMGWATRQQLLMRYRDRCVATMKAIASTLQDDGWHVSDVNFLEGDEYSWEIYVRPMSRAKACELDEDDVDIRLTILESEQNDGEIDGLSFSVEITKVGGEMLGGLTPYNYTDACWVDRYDRDAIEKRFEIIERADPTEIAAILESHRAR